MSYIQIWLHIIFSTKDRYPFFVDSHIRGEMHAYLAGICKKLKAPAKIVGGVQDHTHLLCSQSKILSVADLVKEVKRNSSAWVKKKYPTLGNFGWQNGYGAFSVSQSGVKTVKRYIERQEEHHSDTSFKEEFREFLDKYEVSYEEKYLWN